MYSYEKERSELFTERNQILFLKIRDRSKYLLQEAGAFRAQEVWQTCSGDSYTFHACLDRLVELGEILELTDNSSWGQHRVFTEPIR